MKRLLVLSAVTVGVAIGGRLSAEVTAERCEHGVIVKIDGEPFCEYWTRSGAKPIVWPILGPGGIAVTRSYPMKTVPGEKADHPHHRSLWFTHGDVNHIDFWAESSKQGKLGVTVHREFVRVSSGVEATIVTRNDWIGPDGKKQCEDQRTLGFGVYPAGRYIDFAITLRASEGPVVFGDTKEGSFGMRVAETLRVDAKKGGQIVNSDGLTDAAAWGKRASWVDYHGPVEGQTQGIAILNHPGSFRYPTYWHVRTYGLFAANPFGPASFSQGKGLAAAPPAEKGFTLEKGQEIHLRYRVLLHKGDQREGQVATAFADFAK
jgi:hypothetical protein